MKGNKKKKGGKKKKPWKEPDFEIHSLLDERHYIRGVICDTCADCDCTCDPAGS